MSDVFIENCKNGRFDEINKQFQENTSKQNKALIAFNFYQGFRFACEHGHLDVANHIANKLQKIQLKLKSKEDLMFHMFSSSDEYAFRHACANGHAKVVKWILQHHSRINIYILDNYAFRKACLNAHENTEETTDTDKYKVVELLLPLMHQSTLFILFDESSALTDETKIFIIDWFRQFPEKFVHLKLMFSHMCIGGNIAIAQYIYNNVESSMIHRRQWDTIFRRTSYNYKFKLEETNKNKYLAILQWLKSLFPERYFVQLNAAAAAANENEETNTEETNTGASYKCFIFPLNARSEISDDLIQEKVLCNLCKKTNSDIIGCCGHQYCTQCTLTALIHPDYIYPFCIHCNLHMDECYSSTYDYMQIKSKCLVIREDLMKERFHPRNLSKFGDWGIDGFSEDDEYDYTD